jgi:aspartate kinase
LVLKGEFGDAVLDPSSYSTLARAFSDFEGIVIYPGFFGYTKEGKVATFPRGGSDITGSILAAAVCADVYENFTDVDSVYPVDPRIVPEVKEGIPTMTYREMRELAYAGFGVFNDDAVIPAVRARIPINIRNTNHPTEPGTMIQQSRRVVPGTVVGIASADGFCNIVVDKYLMNREVGFGRRLLQILEDEGIGYEHMPSGVDSQCVVVKEQFLPKEREHKILQRIRRELSPDSVLVERDITILMIVGEGMCYTAGMFAKACLALASAGINISMVNQGSSEVSFMIAIRKQDRDTAVRALYKAFFG